MDSIESMSPREFWRHELSDQEITEEFLSRVMPGEKWDDDHHRETPHRFYHMLHDLTDSESEAFKFTTFESDSKEMVVVRDLTFYTFCSHHIIPFFGKCHIGYIPDGRIVGLSKMARTVKFFCKGLWAQEELTTSICNFIDENLEPLGTIVVMEAEHLCMTMRGVQMPGAKTTTSAVRGAFKENDAARQEVMALLRSKGVS